MAGSQEPTRSPQPRAQATPRHGEKGTTAMRAVVQHRYGPPEVLEQAALPIPRPGRGEVLVRVAAAAVHPGDHFLVTGEPLLVRLAFGLRRPRIAVRGRDLAGTVTAVGAGVADLRPGDEVFGWSTTGTLAEYACVPAEQLAPIPAGVSMIQAAAVATSGITALQAIRDIARVQPGQRVLVTGASGGVGHYAVQIAVALGAEVTGVCSTGNHDMVRSLGARAIDYTTTDPVSEALRTGVRYAVVLDNAEAQPLAEMRRALTPTGTLIPNNGHGGRWVGPLGRFARARLTSLTTRQRLRPFTSIEKRADLLTLADMLADGRHVPVIERTYPLADAAEALRHVGRGHARGKAVVTMPAGPRS